MFPARFIIFVSTYRRIYYYSDVEIIDTLTFSLIIFVLNVASGERECKIKCKLVITQKDKNIAVVQYAFM